MANFFWSIFQNAKIMENVIGNAVGAKKRAGYSGPFKI